MTKAVPPGTTPAEESSGKPGEFEAKAGYTGPSIERSEKRSWSREESSKKGTIVQTGSESKKPGSSFSETKTDQTKGGARSYVEAATYSADGKAISTREGVRERDGKIVSSKSEQEVTDTPSKKVEKKAEYTKTWKETDEKHEYWGPSSKPEEKAKADKDPNALASGSADGGVGYHKGSVSSGVSFDLDKLEAEVSVIKAEGILSLVHGEAAGEFKIGKAVKAIWKKLFGAGGTGATTAGGAPMAARVGDLTGHGSPLGPGIGSPNVLIGGKPAWRAIADFHACPVVKGLIPDVGGMVLMGSPTVLINNMMAVRANDLIVEIPGGPNPIAIGEPTVLIGGAGTVAGSGPDLALKGNAKGDLFVVKGEAELGAKISRSEAEVAAKVGASAAVAEGSISGTLVIPIPFTGHALTFGAEGRGSVLSAAAKAEASAGYSKQKGFHAKVGADAALGLGLGATFSIGFK